MNKRSKELTLEFRLSANNGDWYSLRTGQDELQVLVRGDGTLFARNVNQSSMSNQTLADGMDAVWQLEEKPDLSKITSVSVQGFNNFGELKP